MSEREDAIGALWVKDGAKGTWYSGTLQLEGKDGQKIPIVVFRNKFAAENPKAPDYRILRARSKEERAAPDRSILDGRESEGSGEDF